MQSNVSVLPRDTQSILPHFMCSLKKEPPHHGDVKNVLVSCRSSKPCEPLETPTVALDSVDTLLRYRSADVASASPDTNLNDFFGLVGHRDVKTAAILNSLLISSPTPLKHEEPPPTKVTKLPTVDQIMPAFTRSPSTPTTFPQQATLVDNGLNHFASSPASTPMNTFHGSLNAVNPILLPPSQVEPVKPSQDQSTSPQFRWKLLPLPRVDPLPPAVGQHQQKHQQQQSPSTPPQARFILPSTSKPRSIEVTISKQVPVLVPVGAAPAPSLFVLPFAVATALQQQQKTAVPTFAATTAATLLTTTTTTTTSAAAAASIATPVTNTAAAAPPPSVPPQLVVIQTTDGNKAYGTVNVIPPTCQDQPPALPPIRLSTVTAAPAASPRSSSRVGLGIPQPAAAATSRYRPIPLRVTARRPPTRSPKPPTQPPPYPPGLQPAAAALTPLDSSSSPESAKQQQQQQQGNNKPTEILPAPLFAKPSDRHRVSPTIETVPTVQRRHQCPYCTKSCERKDNLQAHIRTHTGERPFHCRFCPKAFPQKDHLRAHIRTHTGEKPYRCTHCPKAFAQLGNLHRHFKTHLR